MAASGACNRETTTFCCRGPIYKQRASRMKSISLHDGHSGGIGRYTMIGVVVAVAVVAARAAAAAVVAARAAAAAVVVGKHVAAKLVDLLRLLLLPGATRPRIVLAAAPRLVLAAGAVLLSRPVAVAVAAAVAVAVAAAVAVAVAVAVAPVAVVLVVAATVNVTVPAVTSRNASNSAESSTGHAWQLHSVYSLT